MRWNPRLSRTAWAALIVASVSGCAEGERVAASGTPAGPAVPKYSESWQSDTPFILPGIRQPETQPADQVELDDAAEVLGVSVGTQHRAYSVHAMSHVRSHVVNDLIGEVPVTVTLCDRTDIARCLTGPARGEPLDLGLGGWKDSRMLIRHAGKFMAQDSQEIPFNDFPFERTTWGEWRRKHPDTDVYLGLPEE